MKLLVWLNWKEKKFKIKLILEDVHLNLACKHKDDTEKLIERTRNWAKDNEERVKENKKLYTQKTKDKKQEYDKQYRLDNKERLRAYDAKQITCECGCVMNRTSKHLHLQSKKHKELMESQTPTDTPE